MATCLIERDLVTQDVDHPNSSPYLNRVDLTIPSGHVVTGSGALITHVWDQATETLVPAESLADATVVSQVINLRVSDGPHPSDASKWRIMLTSTAGPMRIRCWIAVVG